MEKKNTGLVVTIIVLVVLLLGLGGYICYDKLYLDKKDNTPNTNEPVSNEELVKENSFKLSDIQCVLDNNTCSKEVKVSYNNKNHIVKVIKKLSSNEKYAIEVYVDGALLDTIDGGTFYDWQDSTVASDWIKNLDGYIYIVDNKYLALVYRYENAKPSWYLRYYNENKKSSDKDILVASYGVSFGSETVGKDLFNLDKLEFNGNAISFWSEYCKSDIKPDADADLVIAKHSVTFDGNKVNDNIVKTANDAIGGGSSACEVQYK